MASIIRTVADGTLAVYPVSFPYLDKSHVKVYKNGILVPSTDYTWPTSGSIQFTAGVVAAGVVVTRKRQTPILPLTVFTPGNLDVDDLNVAVLQPLYLAEEGKDGADLAWTAFGAETPGTIQKGIQDDVPIFNSDGNLQPGTTLGAINGAAAAAASALASLAATVVVAAGLTALVPSISSYVVSHYTALASATIPASITKIVLGGRGAFGDRAGYMPCNKVGSAPVTHNGWGQSADGAYWEFSPQEHFNVAAFGAVSSSLVSDFAAINGAMNYVKAYWGQGEIYFPRANGAYGIDQPLTINTRRFNFRSDGQHTTAWTMGADITPFKFSISLCSLRELTVYGKGGAQFGAGDLTFGATGSAVWTDSSAVNTMIDHCAIFGGLLPLRMEGGDSKAYRNECSLGYGLGLCYVDYGHYFFRNAMDQAWPVNQPSGGYQSLAASVAAWGAGQVVAAGDLRTNAGFVMQCRVGGTCGGSLPSLQNYFVDIADGATVKWQLVCAVGMAGYRLGTLAREVSIIEQDLSHCGDYGITVVAGNTDLRLKITNAIIGQQLKSAMLVNGGKDITIEKIHTGVGFAKDNAILVFSGDLYGDIRVANSFLEGGFAAVYFTPNTPNTVSIGIENTVLNAVLGSGGTAARAMLVTPDVKYVAAVNNRVGASCTEGFVIQAGAGDHIQLIGNINKGSMTRADFIKDSSTGLNKLIENPGQISFPRKEVLLFEKVLNYNTLVDQQLDIKVACSSWEITRIRAAKNSGDISAMRYGLYTLAAGAGIALVAAGSDLAAVTAAGKATTATPTAEGLDEQTAQSIFFKGSVTAGSARTGTYSVYGYPLS